MRKLIAFLLMFGLILSLGTTALAAELDPTEIDVIVEYEENISGEYRETVTDGGATINTDDGITVAVTDAPSGAVTLVVIPMERDAKEWIDGCVDGSVLLAYDIHFLDANGNRINANGAKVSITASGSDLTVCSVTTSGDDKSLTANVSDGKVSFTTDGSHYYAIAEKIAEPDDEHDIEIKQPEGGDVEISDPTPETGDTVIITPKPDEGKEVEDVIVKDEDGNEIPVTENDDGTYSYEQPDGDVTIEVIFRDEVPAPAQEYDVTVEKTSGGTVTISDDTPCAGDIVTITVKPNDGKKVSKVTVTDADGKAVKVTKNADGTYSYIQPDSDVTVKVTFRDVTIWDNPPTGDSSNVFLWLMIMIAALAAMIWLFLAGRRRRSEEK